MALMGMIKNVSGSGNLNDFELSQVSTTAQNGTQTVSLTFTKIPSQCLLFVLNPSGNELSISSSDVTITTIDTDDKTYIKAKLSGITNTTVSFSVTHNRAGVNQAANLVAIYY